ncbi:MAG TPA: shikimate kinase [Streptosporangiaceae bacterium]
MIVLVGFMGAGKTTVGQLLARRLGLPFADADIVIADRAGIPVPRIFAERGEPAFRELEHETIASLLAGPRLVLALGGGAVEHEQTRRVLAAAEHTIYLHVRYEAALDRVGGDDGRPMLRRPDLAEVYRRRLVAYSEVATLTIDTEGRVPELVCTDIVRYLAGSPAAR